MVSSSSSGSLKRNRAPSNGSMITSCLVEGCVSDLSKCREYHRRHKVCEIHSKTPIVMVGGREQRFCQQCSRFHLLVEFDEVKRSCRKRLEGHNRRRRKPQLNSLNSRSFMTNHQGNRLASYPRTFSITTPNPIWAPLVKEEEAPFYPHLSPLHPMNDSCNFQYFPVSSHGSYRGGKQFPFLHENSHASVYSAHPLMQLNSISSSASTSRNTQLFFDSDCAHSLLSSSSVNNPQPGFSISGTEHENAGTVFITDGNDVDFQCHSLFHVGVEGSLDGSQTLSFSCQ